MTGPVYANALRKRSLEHPVPREQQPGEINAAMFDDL